MNKDLLGEYAILEEKLKLLESKKIELREAIVLDLKSNKLEKFESGFGSFTIGHRTNWKYSKKVKELEEKVSIAKDKEQKKGIAKSEVVDYLLFKAVK